MITNRISLVTVLDVLFPIDSMEGNITSILLNVSTPEGTRTLPRFNSMTELNSYMNSKYKFTKSEDFFELNTNEGIYTLLSFKIVKDDRAVFVNNLPSRFQTAKPDMINEYHFKNLQKYKTQNKILENLFRTYVTYPYIENGFIDFGYIEILKNEPFFKLLELYKNTRTK
tara:strand:- start:310 stop:819 length:510 start_codon:yes stop_codon:yes gene_type:complete